MYNFKKIIVMFFVFSCLMSVSCVSAHDIGVNSTDSDTHVLNQESSIVVSDDVSGSFSELNNDIKNLSSGDTYNFNKDYCFNSMVDSALVDGICVNANNVVINGNNHLISGNNISSIFKVYGNDVKIINLNFVDSNGIHESVIDSQGSTDYIPVHNYSYNSQGLDNHIAVPYIPVHNYSYSPILTQMLNDALNIKVEFDVKKLSPTGYAGSSSPVSWYGDNGYLYNCTFNKNKGVNGGAVNWIGNGGIVSHCSFYGCNADLGGAVSWSGNAGSVCSSIFDKNTANNGGAVLWNSNDGSIYDCKFLNNEARCVGGAVCIGGSNNMIRNSIFINCPSQLLGEAIYLNCNRVNTSLQKNAYKGNILYIDGIKSNIDVNAIKNFTHYSQVADEKVDLFYLIFKVLNTNQLSYLDNGMLYYGNYNNGEFTLHVTKFFSDISFTKNYYFKSLTNRNDIFDDLDEMKYETSITLIYSIELSPNVRINDDYKNAITTNVKCFKILGEYLLDNIDGVENDANLILNKMNSVLNGRSINNNVTFGLNINFCGACSVRGDYVLKMDNLGFDIININGNGSKIFIKSGDHDENKWAIVGANKILHLSNITIEGYNTAIENLRENGCCILDDVTFNENRKNYYFDRDYGAALMSTGYVECNNCKFTKNYAKYGGAIFNQGLLCINDCEFSNNKGYGKGNNVCLGVGGVAIVNNECVCKESSIVTRCSKDLKSSTFMDWLYKEFPKFKQNNEYSENPSSYDIFNILQIKLAHEALNVIKNSGHS